MSMKTSRSSTKSISDLWLAILVGACLWSVYLLSFSGQFRSIDEYALYARTESLAQGRGLDTPQLAFAPMHHPVGQIEPGQSVLAVPLYLLARDLAGVSNIASVMLFNVAITAATGAVLLLVLRQLEFTQKVSALTVLAWGIGTTAWPYARSFFREPLLALVWMAAILLCLVWQRSRRIGYAIGCMIVLALGLAVKISSIAAVPVFVLGLLWDPTTSRLRVTRRHAAALGAAALLAFTAASLLHSTRYGRALNIAHYLWEYPFYEAVLHAYGLFLSPVKGLLFFSPIVIAAAVGWAALYPRHAVATVLALGVALSLLYVYGRAPVWHGGHVVWGPRFIVPLLPLLMLPYAAALSDGRRIVQVWVIVWTAIGGIVQAAAGTASWSDAVWQMVPAYVGENLTGLSETPWYSWGLVARSPALVQVLGWNASQLDLIWLRALTNGSLALDIPLGFLLVSALILIVTMLALFLSGRNHSFRYQSHYAAVCLLTVMTATGALLLRSGRNTNDHWGLARADAREIAHTINAGGSSYAVVLVSNDFFINYWLGHLKGRYSIHWHSPHDERGLAEVVGHMAEADRVWLVIDHNHMPEDADPYLSRHSLARQAYELMGRWVDGYEIFAYAPPQTMVSPVVLHRSWTSGIEVRMLEANAFAVGRGETILLDLTFVAQRAVEDDLTLFVHLVSPAGATLTSRDGQPHYGGTPTLRWEPGEVIIERRAVQIPAPAAPGAYDIAVGWLEPDGAVVAPTMDEGPVRDQRVIVGTVTVLP